MDQMIEFIGLITICVHGGTAAERSNSIHMAQQVHTGF